MIRSAVTISLVPEARGGPFVFWSLEGGCRAAARLGFDAVEIFAKAVDPIRLGRILRSTGLALAAMGTGAGWVLRRLSLAERGAEARTFVRSIIDLASEFGAPAIVGSMQGRAGKDRRSALSRLADALGELALYAKRRGAPLWFEPLNRYETDMVNTLEDARRLTAPLENVELVADLFHLNIEEPDIAGAIRSVGRRLGHVQFADSNRRPAGCGHIDYRAVARILAALHYAGYVSAETLPWPNASAAARRSIAAYRKYFKC